MSSAPRYCCKHLQKKGVWGCTAGLGRSQPTGVKSPSGPLLHQGGHCKYFPLIQQQIPSVIKVHSLNKPQESEMYCSLKHTRTHTHGAGPPEHPLLPAAHQTAFFPTKQTFPTRSPPNTQRHPPAASPEHIPAAWIPVTQPCSGRSYVGRRGFSSELPTALTAAQQNMSSLHKTALRVTLHAATPGREAGSHLPPLPAFHLLLFSLENNPNQLLVGGKRTEREREVTQVFCNLSHSKLQFGRQEKEGPKIVTPPPQPSACITEIPHPLRREKGGSFCRGLAAGKGQAQEGAPKLGRITHLWKKGSCSGGEEDAGEEGSGDGS